MSAQIKVYVGGTADTVVGQADLKKSDGTPYVIPTGGSAVVEFLSKTPGTPVSLSGSEVLLNTPSNGSIQFTISAAKAATMLEGPNLPMDVIITDTSGNKTTFELAQAVSVVKRSAEL